MKKTTDTKSTHSLLTYVNLRTGKPTGNMILVEDDALVFEKFVKQWTREFGKYCRRMIEEEIKFLRPKTWKDLVKRCVDDIEAGVGFQLCLLGHYDIERNVLVQMKDKPVVFASFVVPSDEEELKVFLEINSFKERFGYELQN